MKRILITGANSYIGTSFEHWMAQWPEQYEIETVSTLNEEWQEKSFKDYDAVLHVAAIVHKKEKRNMQPLYQATNCDLAVAIAQKAKQEGVHQFIFLSTMAVYGMITGVITKDSAPNPKTMYAKSKLAAEQKLCEMQEPDVFEIAILRPPMVYGEKCPGNYARLEKLALKSPIFPDLDNQRSMIHIDNLSKLIKHIVDKQAKGIFHPQDQDYVNVKEVVCLIAQTSGKRIRVTPLFNPLIKIMSKRVDTVNKVFGNLTYELDMSENESSAYRDTDIIQTPDNTQKRA